MSVNRIVALLTPVFSAGAAIASAYLAKQGLNLPADEVVIIEVSAATAALTAALKWLHGHQAFERIVADAKLEEQRVVAFLAQAGVKDQVVQLAKQEIARLEGELEHAVGAKAIAQARTTAIRRVADDAERRLSRVAAAVTEDANLVLPNQPTAAVQSVDQPPVAADVPALAEQQVNQGAEDAPVPTIAEQAQQT